MGCWQEKYSKNLFGYTSRLGDTLVYLGMYLFAHHKVVEGDDPILSLGCGAEPQPVRLRKNHDNIGSIWLPVS